MRGRGRATRVVVLAPSGSSTRSVAARERAVVGRAPECDVVVALPSISRRHLEITGAAPGERPLVKDLGGTHGVRVGGAKITPGEQLALKPGQFVELGDVFILVHPTDEPAILLADVRVVHALASSDLSVVIAGERGTGKSFVAATLLGAAPGGSVTFHDNVEELPRNEGRFIVTTTRRDLAPLDGAIIVRMESLRERPKFAVALAQRYLAGACAAKRMQVPAISEDAVDAIRVHPWRGNVLELKTTIERALERSGGQPIERRHLAFGEEPG